MDRERGVKRSAYDLHRDAATHLAHAASLLLDPRPTPDKAACALVHCGLAMLDIAEADGGGRARELAEAFVRNATVSPGTDTGPERTTDQS